MLSPPYSSTVHVAYTLRTCLINIPPSHTTSGWFVYRQAPFAIALVSYSVSELLKFHCPPLVNQPRNAQKNKKKTKQSHDFHKALKSKLLQR